MQFHKIETDQTPKVLGPYSQAIVVDNLLFISGQIPIDPKSGVIIETTIQGQTRQVLENLEMILRSDGLTFEQVVRVEVFVKEMNDLPIINAIYGEKFSHPIKPVRQLIQVVRLPLDSLIEISCIAVRIATPGAINQG